MIPLKKKILFVSNSMFSSGAEKILLNLIKGLSDTQLFSTYLISGYKGELYREAKELGIETYFIDMHFNVFAFRIFRHIVVSLKIILFILNNKIEIIYCNRAITGKYGSISKLFTGVKCVWHLHDFYNNYWGEKFARSADLMIAVSNSVKNSFPIKDQDKIVVVYNGLEFTEGEQYRLTENLKNGYNIKDADIIVTLPGRITEWKGQEFLLEVASIVIKKRDNIRFIILGDVIGNSQEDINFKQKLASLINNLGLADHVFITGWEKKPERVIRLSHLVLNCSLKPEPLATTIIEAMYLGKPVICLDSGGNSEMVIDGENGIVVKSKDTSLFANAIFEIIDNQFLYNEMAAKSLERAKLFSYEKFINNIKTSLVSLDEKQK